MKANQVQGYKSLIKGYVKSRKKAKALEIAKKYNIYESEANAILQMLVKEKHLIELDGVFSYLK